MSLGYAQKLSYKEDLGGSFGKPELVEPGPEVRRKALLLADLVGKPAVAAAFLNSQLELLLTTSVRTAQIKSVERVVVFTGAGISTSAGIPDFRLVELHCCDCAEVLNNAADSRFEFESGRGPQGVWTLQKQGLPFEAPANAFAIAKPSLTHLVSPASCLVLLNVQCTPQLPQLVSSQCLVMHACRLSWL